MVTCSPAAQTRTSCNPVCTRAKANDVHVFPALSLRVRQHGASYFPSKNTTPQRYRRVSPIVFGEFPLRNNRDGFTFTVGLRAPRLAGTARNSSHATAVKHFQQQHSELCNLTQHASSFCVNYIRRPPRLGLGLNMACVHGG